MAAVGDVAWLAYSAASEVIARALVDDALRAGAQGDTAALLHAALRAT
jgi:hypothetical protein